MQESNDSGEKFTAKEIETAKVLLEWAKLQTAILPSMVKTPFLNVYHAGKRVVTFSPFIHKREDIEIPFRDRRSKKEPIYLLEEEEDRNEGIVKLSRIGIQRGLNPNRRKNLKYSDIPNPESFCKVLDWIVDKIDSETQEIQQFKDKINLINENILIDEKSFEYKSFKDARKYIETSIVLRQGQPQFRQKLIEVYKRCIVTGCGVEDVLEAAHIHPYQGKATNIVQNGLLLRADIHTLFDRYLLTINPKNNTIKIALQLLNTEYKILENQLLDPSLKLLANKSLLKCHYLIALSKWKFE
ncbi:HNH endonuclease [Oculatella sp. FACHB-28]|nr:HNH endonuclease [Oculatella sp. FACHB-28]